jgi:signal transduction histidine kinase/ligand-binding sensor domain-containing protein
MKKTFLHIILLQPLLVFSQAEKPLHFEQVKGLSQSTVYSVMKDRQGFLWIATANGLNRFDGVEMKIYKPFFGNAPGQMRGRIIRSAMLEDDEEQIWFSTDIALHSFNKRTRQFTRHKLFFARNKEQAGIEQAGTIESFANPLLIKENYLWLASASEGLYVLNTKNGNCISYPVSILNETKENFPLMYNGVHDESGRFWFASNKGLLAFDSRKKQWNRLLKDKSFYCITRCRDTLYLGNNEGVRWVDCKTLSTGIVPIRNKPAFVNQGMIRCYYSDSGNNIWAGDQTGNIYHKTARENQFVWKGNINGLPVAQTFFPVYCLYSDTTGNLWAGADVLGFLKTEIEPPAFYSFPKSAPGANGGTRLFIHSVYEDEEENIWLGTFQNGLLKHDPRTGETSRIPFSHYEPSLPYGRSVPLIKEDSRGNLWTSYSGYLYIREKTKQHFIPLKIPHPPDYLQSPQLWSMIEYKNGWLLATNIGLYVVNKDGDSYHISQLKFLTGAKITALWTAPGQQIWVIPETGGIYIAPGVEELKKSKRLLTGENVKAVSYDSLRRLIWICTTSGLVAHNPRDGQLKVYTESNGLMSSYVYGALISNDEIWVSTNKGLSRGKMQFSETAVFPEIRFVNFTESEGLPANEFNTGAYHRGRSGKLYFGTVKAVVWFRPETINIQKPLPVLRLIEFRINDKPADTALSPEYISHTRLAYYENNLFFRFRAIDFNDPAKISYAYQLQNWDRDWVHSGGLNEVHYNKLPPGHYVFKIKAANQTGEWTNELYQLSVIIRPPFWQTWWFYTLVGFFFIGLTVFITQKIARRKLKQKIGELERQQALDKERQRISREMHDDIGAGLTQIILMSDSAKNKATAANEKELLDISSTSRRLVNNMSEIIWSLNPENKTLEQLLSYMREQLHKQLEYSGISYRIDLPDGGSDVLLSNEQLRNMLLVTKEIVNNAIKYSQADTISVSARCGQGFLHFEVKDDGAGFDLQKKYSGNGLRNIRQRTEEIGGRLTIDSAAGRGSRFLCAFPLNTT